MNEPTTRDPAHRVSYAFEPDGDDLWVYTWLEPGGKLPEHFHPVQEERWEVLEGRARIQVGAAKPVITPADGPQIVAPGVKHSVESVGDEVARLRCHVLPAGDLQEFLEDSSEAAREGLVMRGGIPRGLRGARWGARFIKRHRAETVMTFPPRFAQNALIALLARD
jgi:mannose-6-phosphate isomerase-like protein (cupin superfamily)